MSCVGRSEMNPTVSDRMTSLPEGSSARRSVGSSVANSLTENNSEQQKTAEVKQHCPSFVSLAQA